MLNVSNTDLANLVVATSHDREMFQKKFSIVLMPAQICDKSQTASIPLLIDPRADRIVLRSMDVIRMSGVRVLYRSIETAVIVQKTMNKHQLHKFLCSKFSLEGSPQADPGLILRDDSAIESFSRQLLSLCDQDVKERILDQFIQKHTEHFRRAFRATLVFPQAQLRWVTRTSEDPDPIIPDYLLVLPSGRLLIVELKRAFLIRKSITKGKPGRIRFVDYVDELIAQLNGYKRYFGFRENREAFRQKYGYEVSNPGLVGIVGSYDTFESSHVEIALESYREDLSILSYSDLIDLVRRMTRAESCRMARLG
jgi:hypothetical protein